MTSYKKTFISNFVYSFGTQLVSIVVSMVMTLGIPRVLSIEDYGYWQLFIFYIGYIGFFQLGLSDGLYLRLGGSNFNALNKRIVKSELLYSMFFQLLIGILLVVYIYIYSDIESPRREILFYFSVYLIIGNLYTWLGFILLATNNIKTYSKSVLIEKVLFILILGVLLFIKLITFHYLIIFYTLCKALSLLYLIYPFKSFRKVKVYDLKKSFTFIKNDISTGIILMLSNVVSTLILGIGRFAIDDKWDIITFGKVSLALSATFFFILLISQVSYSLFPLLRKIKYDKQKVILQYGSSLIGVLMLGFFILYYPLVYILNIWIPKYSDSLQYLIILLPICLYEGKMKMINTTYIKVLNKQKSLLIINFIVLTVSILLTVFSVYYLENIYALLFSMLFSLALRSIISQVYLFKIFNLKVDSQLFIEIVLSVVFIVSVLYMGSLYSFVIYSLCYVVYLFSIKSKIYEYIIYFK